MWNLRLVWHGQSRAEVIPEGDAEFGACLVEAEKGIAAIATRITSGTATHLSVSNLTADVVFRSIGVQRNLGPIEHHEQLTLVGVKPCEQTVEGNESGLACEDAIEAGAQGSPALLIRILAIVFEIAIKRPDQSTNSGLGLALIIGKGVELVNSRSA
jgi:hypothetical protein